MPNPVLYRFETTLFRNNTTTDAAQVPYAGAGLNFYRQGATVRTAKQIGAGAIEAVEVYDPGDLRAGDLVSVGDATLLEFGAAELVVDQVPAAPSVFLSPVQIQLRNPSAAQVTVPAGKRLVVLTRRPDVFADPLGTVPLGRSIAAGVDGRVGVYVSLPRFDYLVRGVGVLSRSSGTIAGSTTLTWEHMDHGAQAAIVVGISWNEAAGEPPQIASVKYGGLSMTLMGTSGFTSLYRRLAPFPAVPGAQTIEVVFSKLAHAVGGAVGLSNVDAASFPTIQTGVGSGNSPQVVLSGTGPSSEVISVLTVNTNVASPVATADSTEYQRWNAASGAGLSYCLGAGATRESKNLSTEAKWNLSAASSWEMIVAEARPVTKAVTRLYLDGRGGLSPNPTWLNARDFKTLTDAIKAIPSIGGELFLPARTYETTSTLVINKPNLVLRGENKEGTVIIRPRLGNPFEVVRVSEADCRLLEITIHGGRDPNIDFTPIPGRSSLVLDPGAVRAYLENVTLKDAFANGLEMPDVGSVLALNTEAIENLLEGMSLARTSGAAAPSSVRLLASYSSANRGCGLVVEGANRVGDTLLVMLCGFESNQKNLPTPEYPEGNGVTIRRTFGAQLISNYFEWNFVTGQPDQFIYGFQARGLLVAGSWFWSQGDIATSPVLSAMKFRDCSPIVLANNGGYKWMHDMAILEDSGAGGIINTVEFGSHKYNDSTPIYASPTFGLEGQPRLFGLSQGAMQLASFPQPQATVAQPGGMRWVADPERLEVYDGFDWREVKLLPPPPP